MKTITKPRQQCQGPVSLTGRPGALHTRQNHSHTSSCPAVLTSAAHQHEHQHLPKEMPAGFKNCVAVNCSSGVAVKCLSTATEQRVGADAELLDYICNGPLLAPCGITPEQVYANAAEWMRLGERLALQLQFDFGQLDSIQRLRIFHYYLPVFFWVQSQLQQHKAKHKGQQNMPPMVLGISAPQGCGKTTIVEQLEELFNWLNCPTASVSIDDFYLTHADQSALAAEHPDNRLLQLRGNAGTHDVALGRETLKQLKGLSAAGSTAAVPRYDKSAFGGRGDRAPKENWPVVQGPLQLVLFEGWMLGFKPVGAESAAAVEAALAEVDARLGAYQQAWDSAVDAWLVVRISDPQWVFGWRLQAEQRMRAEGKAGMSDAQIADFVSRYIPAYQAYLPGLYAAGPTTATAGRTLTIEVDQSRAPIAQQPAPVM